jgi:hypothetical protein
MRTIRTNIPRPPNFMIWYLRPMKLSRTKNMVSCRTRARAQSQAACSDEHQDSHMEERGSHREE